MRSSFARVAASVAASVAVPVLLGAGTVYLLAPPDPPDLGWGHTATHAIPAAVLVGVLLLGRRWWPPALGRAGTAVRRVLIAALAAAAVAQAGEATAAALGTHDGIGHTVPMVIGGLAVPVVLLAGAATVLLAVARRVAAWRREGAPARTSDAPVGRVEILTQLQVRHGPRAAVKERPCASLPQRRCGGRGIRTLGPGQPGQPLSRRSHSATMRALPSPRNQRASVLADVGSM